MPILELSPNERLFLLNIARESVLSALERRPERHPLYPEIVTKPCGAFVTLKKNGELRGCIGRLTAVGPLVDTVRAMARSAAFEDPRFPPLCADEWPSCSVEISVLTPMEPCDNPDHIEIGKHGLFITQGFRSGVLLPQVPVEWGWDRTTFLQQTCLKAGLPLDAWKSQNAQLFTFQAIVIV